VCLSVVFYVTNVFQWYFTEVEFFRCYRTNFPFNLLLVEHLEVSEIGERFNKKDLQPLQCYAKMIDEIQQFHLAMHPNQDSN